MRALALVALIATASCVEVPAFRCDEDAQCGDEGRCEDDHACSFEDEACHAGRRYGDLGEPEVAGRCIGEDSGAVAVLASGSDHACAIAAGGAIWCWGDNTAGNLGRDDVDASSEPAAIELLAGATDLDGGEYMNCAVVAGEALCWGRNDHGELGDGTTVSRWEPRPVPGLTGVVEVELGELHTCARDVDGAIWCWGDNEFRQSDNSGRATIPDPTRVAVPAATSVVAGGQTVCAITGEGVYCWGKNANGQLGVGDTDDHNKPELVAGFAGEVQIAVGGEHTCAVMGDHTVRCTGANGNGQLGDGSGSSSSLPVEVADLTDVAEITALDWSTCARTGAGAVLCWGRNDFGQVGAGGDDLAVPGAAVTLPAPAIAITGGENHACAQTSDGCVFCWGKDADGQLGAGRGDQTGTIAPALLSCF
jgi:alpha-tubulin suppressor-like RCC1 family protein